VGCPGRAGQVAACWHVVGFSRAACGSQASQRGKDQFRSARTAITAGSSALRITVASISSLGFGQFVGQGGMHRGLLGDAAGLLSAGCRSMAVVAVISSPVPSHRWTCAGGSPVSRSTQSASSPNAAWVVAWIWGSVHRRRRRAAALAAASAVGTAARRRCRWPGARPRPPTRRPPRRAPVSPAGSTAGPPTGTAPSCPGRAGTGRAG
jgi:hypothetical protein